MFPSAVTDIGPPKDFFLEQVANLAPLQVLAVAAQRGASWAPDDVRQAIRAASAHANHPLERRILALAALGAGEERNFVRGLLREFEQNDVTLRMLESTEFRTPRIAADFR
jgi:hypothetical protein